MKTNVGNVKRRSTKALSLIVLLVAFSDSGFADSKKPNCDKSSWELVCQLENLKEQVIANPIFKAAKQEALARLIPTRQDESDFELTVFRGPTCDKGLVQMNYERSVLSVVTKCKISLKSGDNETLITDETTITAQASVSREHDDYFTQLFQVNVERNY